MPKGPHGEKRPADVIGNAVMVARIVELATPGVANRGRMALNARSGLGNKLGLA
jgi:hypothetical protein